MDRAVQVVRLHGDCQFSQGGSAYDVLHVLKNQGICQEDAMPFPGSLYGDSLNNFNELPVSTMTTSVFCSHIWRTTLFMWNDLPLPLGPRQKKFELSVILFFELRLTFLSAQSKSKSVN